ncbi:hypothetical protein Taro_031955 [Colocasia esculenta]|uniref:Uncharacterized protein n=1 Tax=Colocasia esculenta TaxID=4460 RepID=A0A843VW06_COLES|nr:hypothetical protein [Colocasia esculenta]
MLTTHTAGNARRTSHHNDRPATNSCNNESLPEESRGPEQQELQQKRKQTTLESSKARNAYHKVLQSSETEKHLNHNPSQANDDSRQTSGVKHNAEATPRHTPAETKELTKHRSNHVRPESHDTSTNIPDLHEVGKEQPDVTMRDIEQPREKHRLTTSTATSDLHMVDDPQAEPPCTSDTPRVKETTPYSATTDGTKERDTEIAVECLHQAP